jgi:putative membrane protein
MLWIKSFHIVAVISWMAAMLYLPRLLVYHAETERGSAGSETFKIMERRLLKGIANPAMLATWIFGLWLAIGFGYWREPWLWAKFACVLGLSAFHGFLARSVREFSADQNVRTARFFRIANELPTLLMVVIVLLVVLKPS